MYSFLMIMLILKMTNTNLIDHNENGDASYRSCCSYVAPVRYLRRREMYDGPGECVVPVCFHERTGPLIWISYLTP